MRKIFFVATLIVFLGFPFLKPVLAEDADSGKDVKEGWQQKMEETKAENEQKMEEIKKEKKRHVTRIRQKWKK